MTTRKGMSYSAYRIPRFLDLYAAGTADAVNKMDRCWEISEATGLTANPEYFLTAFFAVAKKVHAFIGFDITGGMQAKKLADNLKRKLEKEDLFLTREEVISVISIVSPENISSMLGVDMELLHIVEEESALWERFGINPDMPTETHWHTVDTMQPEINGDDLTPGKSEADFQHHIEEKFAEIGKNIRRFRIASELSQKDLGFSMGKTKKWVNDIEGGKVDDLPFYELEKIAELLGCTVPYLAGEMDDMEDILEMPLVLRKIMFYGSKEEKEKLIAFGEKLLKEQDERKRGDDI